MHDHIRLHSCMLQLVQGITATVAPTTEAEAEDNPDVEKEDASPVNDALFFTDTVGAMTTPVSVCGWMGGWVWGVFQSCKDDLC